MSCGIKLLWPGVVELDIEKEWKLVEDRKVEMWGEGFLRKRHFLSTL